ncbi:hypothetical protein V8E53_009175 [Lactarius tabidus]
MSSSVAGRNLLPSWFLCLSIRRSVAHVRVQRGRTSSRDTAPILSEYGWCLFMGVWMFTWSGRSISEKISPREHKYRGANIPPL